MEIIKKNKNIVKSRRLRMKKPSSTYLQKNDFKYSCFSFTAHRLHCICINVADFIKSAEILQNLSNWQTVADFIKSATDFSFFSFYFFFIFFYHDLNDTGMYLKVTPILSSTPPSPKTILTLTQFQKNSTSASIYRFHFQEIISSFANPIICFTDGSRSKNRVGFAFSV